MSFFSCGYNGYCAAFVMGLFGGAHCLGMCGGIVGALSASTAAEKKGAWTLWSIHLAYSVGRVSTYALLGLFIGSLGAMSLLLENMLPVQVWMYVLANLMVVAMGLYLAGITVLLAPLERLGGHLWRRVQPLTRRFLPVKGLRQAFPLGMLWGLIPCGLVYVALSIALMSGSAERGALTMLSFGAGTLPNLVLAGLLFKGLSGWTRNIWVRRGAGVLVIAFGVFGLYYHAPGLGEQIWNGVICDLGKPLSNAAVCV